MRALTVSPGVPRSTRLEERPEPAPESGEVLVEMHAVGVCGTDVEIVDGDFGTAPAGRSRLVLGHESLGRVLEAPASTGLAAGDWVCGIVRRPDPVPCPSCAAGEWDMCQNGLYTEHGITALDGFAAERVRLTADGLVRAAPGLGERGVLIEPTSVVAKAWDHIERIGRRAVWQPERALVAGAGPIGLLAALLGVQRGLDVHVFDRETGGPKPRLVADLGATYHTGALEAAGRADVVLECTGVTPVILGAIGAARRSGIVCLVGVPPGGGMVPVDAGAMSRAMVLESVVVFGTINANRAHYEAAAAALLRADPAWLDRLITRRVPLASWPAALERRPGDVKTVLTFG